MDSLRMKKSDLLVVLKENKKKHIEEYELASHAYRIACAEALENAWRNCVDGGEIDPYPCKLSKPQSHERDYTMVIGMLEMTTEDEIEYLNCTKAYHHDQFETKGTHQGSLPRWSSHHQDRFGVRSAFEGS